MAPRKPEEFEKIRTEAIERILKSALELFSKKGFNGTTIREIAKNAQISSGLTYNYFSSKEDLLSVIIEKRIMEINELLLSGSKLSSHKERLKFIIEKSLQHVKENIDLYRLYISVFLQPSASSSIAKLENRLKSQLEDIYTYQYNIFESLKYDDPLIQTILLRSTLQGIILEYVMAPDLYPIEQVKERLYVQYKIN